MHERKGLKEFDEGEKTFKCPAVVCDDGAFPRMRRSAATGDVSDNMSQNCCKSFIFTREMTEKPD